MPRTVQDYLSFKTEVPPLNALFFKVVKKQLNGQKSRSNKYMIALLETDLILPIFVVTVSSLSGKARGCPRYPIHFASKRTPKEITDAIGLRKTNNITKEKSIVVGSGNMGRDEK